MPLQSTDYHTHTLPSPDLRESFVCCLGHSAFLEHVITYVTEYLKLFLTGESVSILTVFHDVEHVTLGSDHCHQSVGEHFSEQIKTLCSVFVLN